ncbi:response regulator [Paenibacillus graminis]|uniref:response regulator n=1 Tax=Paenibacillus graminis TaxID=189425 RepID=UPI002DBCE660|nr:response regulator [Paenibacillus graminis]MEC0170324.1 response regulator [Paenibacillus graminis]
MIQALLVDDERLALMKLKLMLEELTTVNIIGSCTDPAEAVSIASKLQPDVIFLDIDMPEMNGMQVAEAIQGLCPSTSIVFVTAYNSYAVEAFELYALDYVLKPVRRDRLVKTIQRLEKHFGKDGNPPNTPEPEIMIRSFQSLRFERAGQPLPAIRWRTSKAQELFAYLFHNRNRFVSKDSLIEMLWPDFNLKRASTHLYTTIYQIRQSLKQADIGLQISNASGGEGYTMETGTLLIDSYEWEKGILTLGPINAENCDKHQLLFYFYSGDYLNDYDYLWAEGERQRLRTIWLHHAMGMAEFFTARGRIPEAVTVYQRVVQLQPYFEQGHLGLMKVYDSMGERSAVEEQYQYLADLLKRELSVDIPDNIKSWYEEWKLHNFKSL